jgi:hypothetical protein
VVKRRGINRLQGSSFIWQIEKLPEEGRVELQEYRMDLKLLIKDHESNVGLKVRRLEDDGDGAAASSVFCFLLGGGAIVVDS